MKKNHILIISFLVLLIFSVYSNPYGEDFVKLGNKREIFIDYYLIDKLEGTKLMLHSPIKEEIVLYFDKPWESYAPAYITILKDDELYRAYYRGGNSLKEEKETTQNTCYAESKDGIIWEKPSLGLIEFKGSKENNILLDTEPETHNFSPFIDKNPNAKPEQKYKAFGGSAKTGLIPYASADGIHWERLQNDGVIKKGAFDSQNVAFWSESEELYICYFRYFDEEKFRSVRRATSKDFINWTEPVDMTYGDTPLEQLYIQQTSPYFRAPHIYVAIGARLFPERKIATEEQLNELKVHPSQHKGLSEPYFMTTRGGNIYDRTFMEAFIRPEIGLNNWCARTNFPALNVVQTGSEEMSLYVDHDYTQPTAHLQRYSMRLDGFTSIKAPYEGGTVDTRSFMFSGEELEINYSTSAVGEIRIEIRNEDGIPISGFTMKESETIVGNEIARTVIWSGNKDLADLANKPVRLRIYMKDADLYSIRFK